MSAHVDALRVLDELILLNTVVASLDPDYTGPSEASAAEARAAFAELIAADSEYDRARAAWLADHSKHNEFLAAREALARRTAALARVKGETE